MSSPRLSRVMIIIVTRRGSIISGFMPAQAAGIKMPARTAITDTQSMISRQDIPELGDVWTGRNLGLSHLPGVPDLLHGTRCTQNMVKARGRKERHLRWRQMNGNC